MVQKGLTHTCFCWNNKQPWDTVQAITILPPPHPPQKGTVMSLCIKHFEEDTDVVNYSKKNNIFDVTSLNEPGTSQLIAWLLDPKESHTLGNAFLKTFIREVNHALKNNAFPGSARLTAEDLKSATILTEQNIRQGEKTGRLDILIVNDKTCIVIENKFGSKEHNNQLSFYKKYFSNARKNKLEKTFFVYLDINMNMYEMEKTAKMGWIPLDYSWISEFLSEHKKYIKEHKIKYILESFYSSVTDESNLDNCIDRLCHRHAELIERIRDISGNSITDFISKKKDFDISLYNIYIKYKFLFDKLIKRYKYINEIKIVDKINNLHPQEKNGLTCYIQKNSCIFTSKRISDHSDENDTYWPVYIKISLCENNTYSVYLYVYTADIRKHKRKSDMLLDVIKNITNNPSFSFNAWNTYRIMSSSEISSRRLTPVFEKQWNALLTMQKLFLG